MSRLWTKKGSSVFLMREPSVHAHRCARQEIADGPRSLDVVDILRKEVRGLGAAARAEGFRVEWLPNLSEQPFPGYPNGYEARDQQGTRDFGFFTPHFKSWICARYADHSTQTAHPVPTNEAEVELFQRRRQPEALFGEQMFEGTFFEDLGLWPHGHKPTKLVLGDGEFFEAADCEFWHVKGRPTAVVSVSARSNEKGANRVCTHLEGEGINVVKIEVMPSLLHPASGKKPMHFTNRAQRLGRHRIGVKASHFKPHDLRKLRRQAKLNVVRFPEPPQEIWSAGILVAPSPCGKHLVAFAHKGHDETNAWLQRLGLKVVPVDMTFTHSYWEGSPDCLVQQIWSEAA